MWILGIILVFYFMPILLMFLLRKQTGLNEKIYKSDLKIYLSLFIVNLVLLELVYLFSEISFIKKFYESYVVRPFNTEEYLLVFFASWLLPFMTFSILFKFLQNFLTPKIGLWPAIIIVALINAVFYNDLLLLGYILSGYIYYKTKKIRFSLFLFICFHFWVWLMFPEMMVYKIIVYSLIGAYLIYILLNQIKTIEVKDDN
jgi:hypothetical protein